MADTDYAFRRSSGEYERLIEQAEIFRPLTERMLRGAGIGAGMHVLDIGCGAGDVSFLASALVGPDGSVTGVDVDGDAIAVAEQRRAAHGIANVSFRQADARYLESGRLFDAAVGRFVLMFIHDPTEALRLFAERVRPGGILAFCEQAASITATSAAQQPVLAALLALFTSVFERSGARPDIGAELYSRMRDAGLRPDPRPLAEFVLYPARDALTYRRWALFARSMLPKIVEYGLGAEEEIRHRVEHDLREELLAATGLVPLSWLMIGQWARVPEGPISLEPSELGGSGR
jgi:ubiquinone/menaquinone biosynthesis C-methylase UbiE